MITLLARALAPALLLGAVCGAAVRVLAGSAARPDLNVVLVITTLLVAGSARVLSRSNRGRAGGWASRGAMLAWPAFALTAALVAGPVWTGYVLGPPLLLALAVGLLTTRPAAPLR